MLRVGALKAVMAGASQKDFANEYGLDASYLSQILNGHRNLGEKAAANLERKIGLAPGSLSQDRAVPPKAGDKPPGLSATEQLMAALEKVKGFSAETRQRIVCAAENVESGKAVGLDSYALGQVGDEVWIAHYDVRAAMGGGQVPHDYPEMLQDVRVSPQRLREMGVEFKEHFHLKMVTGWGQSMAPTIKHRDPLLVDVTIREFVGDGIYLFAHGDLLYIKRLQRKGKDHFKMVSDNTNHPAEDIRVEDTHIQARVLYVWNGQLV